MNNVFLIPAYCDPPNPCPLGYTSKDGCIEDFENSSDFSRIYQVGNPATKYHAKNIYNCFKQGRQKCICDTEHMFNCAEGSVENINQIEQQSVSLFKFKRQGV